MMKKLTLPLALVAAAAFSASPAVAQKGHDDHGDRGEHRARVERRDRDDDDRRDDRRGRDERWRREQHSRSSSNRLQRRVPPGWCIGRGNPHNTVENCGAGRNRYERRYDPRFNNSTGRFNNGSDRFNGSNNRQAYSSWKRVHDQQCANLARQRPLDLRWQAQVRSQCSAQERDARARYGV